MAIRNPPIVLGFATMDDEEGFATSAVLNFEAPFQITFLQTAEISVGNVGNTLMNSVALTF